MEYVGTAPSNVAEWLDTNSLRIRNSAFNDAEVFDAEIENIFNKTWLYLGHESEIPVKGDFVTRPMGSDEVIVSRGSDGKIRAFLNACRHRGVRLCRSDAGRKSAFVCPYHAWTYDNQGALRSTSFDSLYADMDKGEYGLTQVAQLDTYHGLIFATWNADAEPLLDHLGEDLRFYLDLVFGKTPGGMTVLGPPQRWVVDTNWKLPVLNFIDPQHALRTHKGPVMIQASAGGGLPFKSMADVAARTPCVSFDKGHGVVIGAWGGGVFPKFFSQPPEIVPLIQATLSEEQQEFIHQTPPGVGTIYPNISWMDGPGTAEIGAAPTFFLTWRIWQPISPTKIQVWSWYFAPAEASEEHRDKARKIAVQTFGSAGTFEEDDGEIWATIVEGIRGSIASRGFMDFSGGRNDQPLEGTGLPGKVYASQFNEQIQFNFMRRWHSDLIRAGGR